MVGHRRRKMVLPAGLLRGGYGNFQASGMLCISVPSLMDVSFTLHIFQSNLRARDPAAVTSRSPSHPVSLPEKTSKPGERIRVPVKAPVSVPIKPHCTAQVFCLCVASVCVVCVGGL